MRKTELAKWLKKQIAETFNKATSFKCSDNERACLDEKEAAYVHVLWYVLGMPNKEEFSKTLKKIYK